MKILKQDNRYSIVSQFTILEKLDNKVYELEWDAKGNIFLTDAPELSLPTKIYHNNKNMRDAVIKSFISGEKNTGVLLVGDKGTGKSIDAKLICKDVNLPVILISNRIPAGVNFQSFLNEIEQSCVVFIDEFEKMFNRSEYEDEGNEEYHTQKSLLSLLDGLGNCHKTLYVFTANQRVNSLFYNRPSRIKYLVNYSGIEESFAITIIEDLLEDKSFMKDLIDNVDLKNLTNDVLISIIKEINLHKIPYSEFKNIFNYKEDENIFTIYKQNGNSWVLTNSQISVYSKVGNKSVVIDNFDIILDKKISDTCWIYKKDEEMYKIEVLPQRITYVY